MRTENEISPLEIVIVGTGGLATSLYPALSQHHQVSLVSRNPIVARVRFPDATIYSFDHLPESADLIILAVPDDVLNEMVTLFIKIPPRIGIVQVSGAGQLNPQWAVLLGFGAGKNCWPYFPTDGGSNRPSPATADRRGHKPVPDDPA